jgi:glycosyltransferase involved in cell wall biosynthesis
MKVAIVSGGRSAQLMGLGLAERRLLEALQRQADDVDLSLRVVGRRGAYRHARSIGGMWIPARAKTSPRIAFRDANLIHLLGMDLPPPLGKPYVATIHDLSPLLYGDETPFPTWLDDAVSRARLLLTPSRFTARELEQRLRIHPTRLRVFGGAPALEARSARPMSDVELAHLGIRPPYVLRYGGYTRRKNVALLLEAWRDVPLGTLVLCGPPQQAREDLLRKVGPLDRVVVLDYVPESLLARLLRSASGLVTTSEYEGYGLPPLEALAAGTAVVATESEFAREICGDAAFLVEPRRQPLSQAIVRVLSDVDFASALSDKGLRQAASFTWDAAANRVLTAYREAIASGSPEEGSAHRPSDKER